MSKRKEAFKTSLLSKPGHQHAERLKCNSRRQHASRADAIHLKRACLVESNATALDEASIWLSTKQQTFSDGDKLSLEDVNQLQSFIAVCETPLLLFECLQLATNMALGDHEIVVALQTLLLETIQSLAQSPDYNLPFIKRQLSWFIGNMALNSDSCRDVLAPHVIPWLLQILTESYPSQSELESSPPQVPRSVIAWALCNMLRGQSSFVLEQIKQQHYALITTVAAALQREYAYQPTIIDLEMFEELLWCCVYLVAKDDENIVLTCHNSGIVPVIHQVITTPSSAASVMLPAFRVLGNLCLNAAMAMETILQHSSTLAVLCSIITVEVDSALRKGTWRLLEAVVNATANIENASLLQQLLQGVFSSDEVFVQLCSGAISSGTHDLQYSILQILVQVMPIIDLTGIDYFPNLITSICASIREAHISDHELMELAIISLLQSIDRRVQLLSLLSELDIAEVVENVQYTSTNPELSRLAGTLVELVYSEMERAEAA